MDTLSFIAALVQALAWPVTVVLVLLILRQPLAQLIPLLQRLRYRDLELDFGRQVQQLAVEIQRELPGESPARNGQRHLMAHFARLAPVSPRAVVLEAWLALEEAAVEAGKRHQLPLSSRDAKSPILLAQALGTARILDEPKQQLFDRLRNLRNAAAHAPVLALDEESALDYAESALRLADYLRTA